MNRRNILKFAASLSLIPLSYSKNSFSCSGGMSLNFVSGIPDGYQRIESNYDYISGILHDKIKRSDWSYAGRDNTIQVPDIAEQSEAVPLTINLPQESNELKYEKLIIFVEKHIDVLATNYSDSEIPNKKRQVPLNYKPLTYSAVSPMWVATYTFSKPVLSLSLRLNLSGLHQARILAFLVPPDKSSPVQLLQQGKLVRIMSGCDKIIYVDGPLPEGAKGNFYYF